jgi:hypothetical protein
LAKKKKITVGVENSNNFLDNRLLLLALPGAQARMGFSLYLYLSEKGRAGLCKRMAN